VEVVNDEGDKVMTDVAHKQLRYLPLTPRVKWLFLSKKPVGTCDDTKKVSMRKLIVHPSDGDACKALDTFDPYFAVEPRNV
jgi:hypothetical protein